MSGREIAPRAALPARQRQPWEDAGQRGEDCALLFDPEGMGLWVNLGGCFHRVGNLAVVELRMERRLGGYWQPPLSVEMRCIILEGRDG
jgi:hypothetical protein